MLRPKHFYYITHRNNLKSILKKGILSRYQINKTSLLDKIFGPKIKSIHDKNIIEIRKGKRFKGRSLWNYANVYFEARNPMLYRVIDNFGSKNIIVLQINSDIVKVGGVGVTDGNAASNITNYSEDVDSFLKSLPLEQFKKEYWSESDDSKRKIMAELLVPDKISKEKIMAIYADTEETANELRKDFGPLNIIPNPKMFFQPDYQQSISANITLAKGDMFFSTMQTFTISVNTVGIMGKGLASRAKYQFPDVYVHYQDLCKKEQLKMGSPVLYKREENFIRTLMEDVAINKTENGSRWFLLFPTKKHWKESSPIDGIQRGLEWLVKNYKDQNIKSIALPALGCGLGGLSWSSVGPLMCQSLNQMEIKSYVYLPTEGEIPKEQLTPEFLLKNKKLSP